MGNQIRTTILLAVLTAFLLWIGQIIGGDIDRLNRGYTPLTGGSDTLLQRPHLAIESRLIAHGAGQTPQQRRYFGSRLDIPKDIVDEEQNLTVLIISEILRHGQCGQGNA